MNEGKQEEEGGKIEKKRLGKLSVFHRGSKKDQKSTVMEDSKNISKGSDNWKKGNQGQSPPSIEDVKRAVFDTQEQWRSKPRMFNGKAQKYFHQFCGTLNNHLGLFSMLPDRDRYFSIFCGGVLTLIKVRLF